jgi:hypothetical protein
LNLPTLLTLAGSADGLWQHTCFEAFVANGESGYREFNFAPSGEWAAYAFTDYRLRDSTWQAAQSPRITTQRDAESFELSATLPAALFPTDTATLLLGLTAVIETTDGMLSYWALKHPGERPDFHLREGFCLRIATDTTQP